MRLSTTLLATLLAAACGADDPVGQEPEPLEPVPAEILADATGSLDAGDDLGVPVDTILFILPPGRTLGLIASASGPLSVLTVGGWIQVAGTRPVAVLTPLATPVETRALVRSQTTLAVDWYNVRAVAVATSPEHASADLSVGSGFVRERIDPVLDFDVFTVTLAAGQRIVLEMETDQSAPRIAARIQRPDGGARFDAFFEAGPERTQSAVFEAEDTGEYRIEIFSAGFEPDVEGEYRFRVVAAD